MSKEILTLRLREKWTERCAPELGLQISERGYSGGGDAVVRIGVEVEPESHTTGYNFFIDYEAFMGAVARLEHKYEQRRRK